MALNERDIQLVRILAPELRSEAKPSLYLISTKFTNLVRVNLVILKALLESQKRGLMITIDRPHQYISHLMQLHGIDQSNLHYIDAISTHSADTKGGGVAAEYQKGPFMIETLPDCLMKPEGSTIEPLVDISGIDFVLMDNVSTMLTYNPMEAVAAFFRRYMEVVAQERHGPLLTIMVMDKNLYGSLWSFVSGISSKIIELTPEMTVFKMWTPASDSADSMKAPQSEAIEEKEVV